MHGVFLGGSGEGSVGIASPAGLSAMREKARNSRAVDQVFANRVRGSRAVVRVSGHVSRGVPSSMSYRVKRVVIHEDALGEVS